MKYVQRILVLFKGVAPIVIGLVVLVFVIAWLSGIFTEKIEPAKMAVEHPRLAGEPTEEVLEVTQQYFVEAVGTLRSASRTAISSKVLARIDKINVVAGDQVVDGDVLIELDTKDLQARMRQAEQALKATQAAAQQASADFDRVERLRAQDSGAVSQQDYDTKRFRMQIVQAEVARNEQSVTEAKVMLSYGTIKASKSGRIVDRLAEPGDTTSPGQVLLVLYDPEALRLEAPVMEGLALNLEVGQELTVKIDALDKTYRGHIDEKVPQATVASRSMLIKAALPLADGLYEGMFGRLMIPGGERSHLCLDPLAIYRVGQLEYVDVVGSNDQLERRLVKTGRYGPDEERVEVLSGLSAGERVVLRTKSEGHRGS